MDVRRPDGPGVVLAAVTDAELDVAKHAEAVEDAAAGAVVTFAGVVRDHDGGRTVTSLEYVAHPAAGEVLAAVAAEVAAHPSVYAVAVSHRTGRLRIGETALAAAVARAHRAEAFEACARLGAMVEFRPAGGERQGFADGT